MTGETLLKTIKVPTNLANLSSRLPKSNYVKTRASEGNILSSFTKDGIVKSSSVRQGNTIGRGGDRDQEISTLSKRGDNSHDNEYENRSIPAI